MKAMASRTRRIGSISTKKWRHFSKSICSEADAGLSLRRTVRSRDQNGNPRAGLDEISDVQIIVRSQQVRSTLDVVDIQRSGSHAETWHARSSSPCMKILATLLAAAFATSVYASPEVGKPAPEFTLKDLSGQKHQLSDLKGKFVVLEWVNFGCPFVGKQYGSGNMQKLQKEFVDKGVDWLSICSSAPGKQGNETPDAAKSGIAKFGSAATAYLVDEDGKVGRLYGAKTTPDMFVVNPEGVLIYAGAIDDKPTPDPSTVAGSNNYVKAALDEAISGKAVSVPSTKPYGCSVKY
jgi:peroxiredoxin